MLVPLLGLKFSKVRSHYPEKASFPKRVVIAINLLSILVVNIKRLSVINENAQKTDIFVLLT